MGDDDGRKAAAAVGPATPCTSYLVTVTVLRSVGPLSFILLEGDMVVVILHVHRNPTPGGCTAVGFGRTASVVLANPLGTRAVLEVKEGLPVSVSRG